MNYVLSLMKEIIGKRKLIWDLGKADFRKRIQKASEPVVLKIDFAAFGSFLMKYAAQINIAGAIDQPPQFGPNHCAAAHETGFTAGIECIFA